MCDAVQHASLTIAWEICLSSWAISDGFCGGVRCCTGGPAVPYPEGGSSRLLAKPPAGMAALRLGPPGRGSYATWKTFLLYFRPAKAICRITPLMVSARFKNVGATVQGQKRVPIVHPRGRGTQAHACGPGRSLH